MKKFTVRMSAVGILAGLASFGMTAPAIASPETPKHESTYNAPSASSAPANRDETCSTSTDANGNTVENCAVIGEDEFKVNETFSNQETLTLNQHGTTWLTVQVHHMTPSQIVGQCKTLPVGTFIWNGFVNPVTGEVKYQPWHVTSGPGENKFCIGTDHEWHKFNCNNPVKGPQFGTPPPPPAQRLKASVKTGDYVTWTARKKLVASKHIGGSIDVHSQDGTCNAHAELDNKIKITDWMSVTFRSRNMVQAKVDAVNAVKIKAGSSQSLHGKLMQKAKIFINAKISAQCTTTPPSGNPTASASANGCVGPDHPTSTVTVSFASGSEGDNSADVVFDSQPSKTVSPLSNGQGSTTFTVDQPRSYSGKVTFKPSGQIATFSVTVAKCDTPEAPAPDVTLDTMNQVIETKSATTGLSVQVYGGDTATVTISTLYGQITTPKTFNDVSGSWPTTIGYTAPGEIPDGTQSFNDPDVPKPQAGYDQVLVVVVDNQTGKKVKKFTNVKITPLTGAPKNHKK